MLDTKGLVTVSLTLPKNDRFQLHLKDSSQSELFAYAMRGLE